MSLRTITLTDPLYAYLISVSLREPELLARLRKETAGMPEADCQIAPEQGQFMGLLAKIAGVKKAVEIGTFTGYSSLWTAMNMPPGSRLVCCDLSVPWTSVARRYWKEAGLEDRIDLRIGPALATLDGLLAAGEGGSYDWAFIDADKVNYGGYYERCLKLMRPGGLILFDNVLWDGKVLDASVRDGDTEAIRGLNTALRTDPRIDLSLLPVGDGLTLALKR